MGSGQASSLHPQHLRLASLCPPAQKRELAPSPVAWQRAALPWYPLIPSVGRDQTRGMSDSPGTLHLTSRVAPCPRGHTWAMLRVGPQSSRPASAFLNRLGLCVGNGRLSCLPSPPCSPELCLHSMVSENMGPTPGACVPGASGCPGAWT